MLLGIIKTEKLNLSRQQARRQIAAYTAINKMFDFVSKSAFVVKSAALVPTALGSCQV
jgi:hypothetical protein